MEMSTCGRASSPAFVLHEPSRELRKGDSRIRLQEQPFQVLAMLLRRPGEVVTREELQQALWPADTFVEFDQGLNTLRRTFVGFSSAILWITIYV